jgi:hypothetical protein
MEISSKFKKSATIFIPHSGRENPRIFRTFEMKKIALGMILTLIAALAAAGGNSYAQTPDKKIQEVSEADGIPVLIKHLPDWENVRNSAKLAHSVGDLRASLGQRPVFDLLDFAGGTEAVTAPYPQGKLLIVEFVSPASSAELDTKLKDALAGQPIYYRRIGNYNAFVFDAPDEAGANGLLDQVKYEKYIQWLGDNPFMPLRAKQAERNFVVTTADIFLSTLLAIVTGLGVSIVIGIAAGFIFFYRRDSRRAAMPTFSDAGGMTRLNLDGFTPEIASDRLLKD